MGNVKHSITLYGFGQKWRRKQYTFEQLFQISKRLGGDGLELVALQMVPNFPNPTEEWIEYFKGKCAEYNLNPVCYSVYTDNGKYYGRFLTEAERMTQAINDMENAKRFGFPIVRTQEGVRPETLEKLIPYCEELGIHLAPELHGPHEPSTPLWQQFYELFERKRSKYIGVVMDFSSFESGPPGSFVNTIPDNLFNKPLLMEMRNLFETTEIQKKEFLDIVRKKGGTDVDVLIAEQRFFAGEGGSGMGGAAYRRTKADYDGFRALLKYSKYMHGKFRYVDENLNCPGINYPKFVKIMKEENYQGFIASEYEGTGFDPEISDEDQIARHVKMLEKLWLEV